jgi:hypothetical protein
VLNRKQAPIKKPEPHLAIPGLQTYHKKSLCGKETFGLNDYLDARSSLEDCSTFPYASQWPPFEEPQEVATTATIAAIAAKAKNLFIGVVCLNKFN